MGLPGWGVQMHGFDGPLSGARVNGIVAEGMALEWPDVGCTLLESLHPTDLGISKHFLSSFLFFLHGTGECERCHIHEVSLSASDL